MKVVSAMFLTVCVLAASCAKPRVVQEIPQAGGVIAIKNRSHDKSRKKAKLFMAENCSPKSFRIVEEGETVKGEVSYRGAFSQSVHTDKKKEWLIKYKCVKSST